MTHLSFSSNMKQILQLIELCLEYVELLHCTRWTCTAAETQNLRIEKFEMSLVLSIE